MITPFSILLFMIIQLSFTLNRFVLKLFYAILFLSLSLFAYSANTENNLLKFHKLNVDNGLPQNSVFTVAQDKFGFIWVGTWGGLVRYDGYTTKTFKPVVGDSTTIQEYRISCIVLDSTENLWIETENKSQFYKFNYTNEHFTPVLKQHVPVHVIQKTDEWHNDKYTHTQNEFYKWITSDSGLVQVNKKTNLKTIYKHSLSDPFSISDNVTKIIYQDKTENIWIGTLSGGLNYASIYNKPFQNYYVGDNEEGLIDNVVRAVCRDKKGQIWVGTENKGITIINKENDKISYKNIGKELIDNIHIRALTCDSKGRVWVGTRSSLYYYSSTNNHFYKCNSGISYGIYNIFEDKSGRIWLGTMNGLALFDPVKNEIKYFNDYKNIGRYIRSIIEDSNGNLWIASEENGLACIRLKKDDFGNLSIENCSIEGKDEILKPFPTKRTFSVTQDSLGFIWLATDRGLCRINPTDFSYRYFDSDNGLHNDLVMGAISVGNYIWVSHKKGLSRIDIETMDIHNFNKEDGLPGNEYNQNSCYYDKSSKTLYWGSTNGLCSFKTGSIKFNPYPPNVVFTDLKIRHNPISTGDSLHGRIILEKPIFDTEELILLWSENNFQIEFAALHFNNPVGNQYKYKLENFDDHWINTNSKNRYASYSNLDPGSYSLKVFAANSDGVWIDSPKTLKIKILPPWWRTKLAYVIYSVIISIILWFLYNYIVLKVRISQNEKIHSAKLSLFTSISHEFRTPLTLIIDPLEKLINGESDTNKINHFYRLMHRNAQQLLLLINQLLDYRKFESGNKSLNLQNEDIIAFLKQTVSSFSLKAEKQLIKLMFSSSIDQLQVDFDEQKLTIILNNLISNALKYTPKNGTIKVSIMVAPDDTNVLLIRVEDTGVGIRKNELEKIFHLFYQTEEQPIKSVGSGIGLALTKELVELHGGEIRVESTWKRGAVFIIKLPLIIGETKEASQLRSDARSDEEINSLNNPKDAKPLLLIVDDNLDILQYIELNFEKDYQIIQAQNGIDGLKKANDYIPDIIISDLMMPDMDGMKLCEKLKTNRNTSHIPIIMLTAIQNEEKRVQGYETGADAYLTKPFNSNVLNSRIKNLLQQRKQLRDLFSGTSKEKLKKVAVNSADEAFLNDISQLLKDNIEDPTFNIDLLAEKVNMSRSQFYRKLKALTNQSGNDFIMTFKMELAIELLSSGNYNVTETAYKLGYTAPNSFTRAFIKYFGENPTQYFNSNE